MESHLACDGEQILTPATAQMKLADVTLSEISQTQKDKHCVLLSMGGPLEESDSQRQEEAGGGERGASLVGTRFLFGPMREFWGGWCKGCPPMC